MSNDYTGVNLDAKKDTASESSSPEIWKNFSRRLELLLKENDVSAAHLSRSTGIPQPTISRYLANRREAQVEYIVRIADFFHVTVDWLLGRTEHREVQYSADAMEVARLYSLASKTTKIGVKAFLDATIGKHD